MEREVATLWDRASVIPDIQDQHVHCVQPITTTFLPAHSAWPRLLAMEMANATRWASVCAMHDSLDPTAINVLQAMPVSTATNVQPITTAIQTAHIAWPRPTVRAMESVALKEVALATRGSLELAAINALQTTLITPIANSAWPPLPATDMARVIL